MSKMQTVIETYIQAYNEFKIDRMVECLSERCIFENISNAGTSLSTQGKEEFRKLASRSLEVFKNREQKVIKWIHSNTCIVAEIDYSAVLAQDLPNGFKAGEELKLRGVSIFEFEGDKISRITDYS